MAIRTLKDTAVILGLSTDTKPLNANDGTVFKETDTGKQYFFDEVSTTWVNQYTPVDLLFKLANERAVGTANEFGVGVDESTPTVFDESDEESSISNNSPALLFGIYVNETADQPLEIRDGLDNTGQIKLTIPTSKVAGDFIECKGGKFNISIFADIATAATTGNFTFYWRPKD